MQDMYIKEQKMAILQCLKEKIYIHKGAPTTNSKWQTHTKLSSQAGKGCMVKWFGKDIG
jgi:hypothetical protein